MVLSRMDEVENVTNGQFVSHLRRAFNAVFDFRTQPSMRARAQAHGTDFRR